MATKINPDFYGAENTFVTVNNLNSVKRCVNNVGQLMLNNIYTGGTFDTTASPWGVGKSSVSSDAIFVATGGTNWTFHNLKNERANTPMWFYTGGQVFGSDIPNDLGGDDATYANYARLLYKNRISPDVALTTDTNNIKSTMSVDDSAIVSIPDTVKQYAITYADYSYLRLVIFDIWYKPANSNTIAHCEFRDLVNGTVTDVDKIVAIYTEIRERTNGYSTSIHPSIGGSELAIPELYKRCYYNSDNADRWVRPWRTIHNIGAPWWLLADLSLGWATFNTNDGLSNESDFSNVTSNDICINRPNSNFYGHFSDKKQVFDDVSYHWEYGVKPYNSNPWATTIIHNGDAQESGIYMAYCYMELDGDYPNKTEAYIKAILHEAAFFGFPITDRAHMTQPIGSDNVYLPKFDEHLITTGDYVGGLASLSLPNAEWTNIFSTDMPDYDPEYEPDAPPDPDSDFGNLFNEGHMHYRFDTRLKIWCFYNGGQYAGIDTVLSAINNLYLTDPDGNAKWQLDFKGSNPSDYIVGLYATPLIVPHSTGLSTFTLGPVDFNGDIETYTYNGSGHFTFGSINLYGDDYPLFGDFRDFAPYTQIELYIPLCGTVTLDPAFFVGHSVTVDMYYDILTMSCVAAIYRDGITLYKTVNGSIGAQIPITSLDMGSYQNTIHSLESAQKQNDMRLMTSILTMGASAAAAIATGGISLGVGAAALAGGAGLLQTAEQGQQIDYQLDHTAPTVAQTGTAEAQNSFCVGSMYAKLFVKRAKLLSGHNDTVYSKTVGNACCINDYIGNMSGLIVCSNINANDIVNAYGYSPTVDEINAIKQAFSTGVYV